MTNLSHKIRIYPSEEQKTLLVKSCGCARFAWNWALGEYKKQKANNVKVVRMADLKKQFNAIKGKEYPWIYDSPKDANQQPFTFLGTALKRYYTVPGTGYPSFKHKGRDDSFYISNDKFSITGVDCKLPVIGHVRLAEPLRFAGRIMNGTVSRKNGNWYLSVSVEIDNYDRTGECSAKPGSVNGIDLGLKTFATLSNGDIYVAPKPLRRLKKRLSNYQRMVSRKKLGSNNRKKAIAKLAKFHEKISNIRKDFIHKATTDILRRAEVVVIEDLSVNHMMKNHKLARALSDASFSEFRRQLTYKANLFNRKLIVVDRWFPSSKLCSCCGNKKTNLTLSDRVYICTKCNLVMDRDLNAALNLRNEYIKTLPVANGNSTPVEVDTASDSNIVTSMTTNEAGIDSGQECSL